LNVRIPKKMMGIWEAKIENGNDVWAFKIEPDGSINKLIHPLADQINVKQGGYEKEGPDPNTFVAFTIGPCGTSFDKQTGFFTVHIILEGFTLKFPQGEITGDSNDIIKGRVSEDGKIWKADWYSYSYIEGASAPDINEINANPMKLTFYKIDPTKMSEDPNKTK
jgi:hypothetical protein